MFEVVIKRVFPNLGPRKRRRDKMNLMILIVDNGQGMIKKNNVTSIVKKKNKEKFPSMTKGRYPK